jgi:predicted ABC-class ATPase
VRVFLSPEFTGLPGKACTPGSRARGTGAFLARRFGSKARQHSIREGIGKSGEIRVETPGQEVLDQTAVRVEASGAVEARFTVGLPARGRRVMGRGAVKLLLEALPQAVAEAFRSDACLPEEILRHAEANEDADALRAALADRGLVAFVADGAILPRESGVSQTPMDSASAVPFRSPESLRVDILLPNRGRVSGMGIPEGVTLIVGGGYHGKSTLLRALERGVYNHRPGDGRDLVVSAPATVKIRAEDGRSIRGVNISPFIRDLPNGQDTRSFSSPNASGSTSQAANIMEAMEAGAGVLLVDEDTAATNFMIRDRRMQALVPRAKEPITPFVDRIRQLFLERGTSSILVLGGSGDYLEMADTVIAMEDYRPRDVTLRAREVADALPTGRTSEDATLLPPVTSRILLPDSLDPRRGRNVESLRVRGLRTLVLGREEVDLSAVEQIVSWPQLHAIGRAMLLAHREFMDGRRSLSEILDRVEEAVERNGLDVLDSREPGDLAGFRRFELAAALNRARSLRTDSSPRSD